MKRTSILIVAALVLAAVVLAVVAAGCGGSSTAVEQRVAGR